MLAGRSARRARSEAPPPASPPWRRGWSAWPPTLSRWVEALITCWWGRAEWGPSRQPADSCRGCLPISRTPRSPCPAAGEGGTGAGAAGAAGGRRGAAELAAQVSLRRFTVGTMPPVAPLLTAAPLHPAPALPPLQAAAGPHQGAAPRAGPGPGGVAAAVRGGGLPGIQHPAGAGGDGGAGGSRRRLLAPCGASQCGRPAVGSAQLEHRRCSRGVGIRTGWGSARGRVQQQERRLSGRRSAQL